MSEETGGAVQVGIDHAIADIPVMGSIRKNADFGQAIQALKDGFKVWREGWNGKGMYLWLLPAGNVPADWCKEPHLKEVAIDNGGSVECLASIRMKTADGKVLTGWLASQSDIMAEDWIIAK